MSCSDCIQHTQSASAFLLRLFPDGLSDEALPFQGSFEITLSCNVRCSHCYILYPGATDNEMNTEQVKTVLKKLVDGGVLYLLLTGGEILSRPDFEEIYIYAKRLGLILALYTNATLVNERVVELWKKYPPRRIEVTIYGHTEATYETVTGTKGSFKRYRRGVQLILEAGLPLQLKTMIMNSNKHEFEQMRDWSIAQTGQFKYDVDIGPRLDGDQGVLSERLSPKEYVAYQLKDPAHAPSYQEKLKKQVGVPDHDLMFTCGYGVKTFHVDPTGHLHPCMLWRENPFDLLNNEVNEQWKTHAASLRNISNQGGCNSCSHSLACGRCPAASLLEMKNPESPIPYYCDVTAERKRILGKPDGLSLEMSPSST